jgi:hypothetical protein
MGRIYLLWCHLRRLFNTRADMDIPHKISWLFVTSTSGLHLLLLDGLVRCMIWECSMMPYPNMVTSFHIHLQEHYSLCDHENHLNELHHLPINVFFCRQVLPSWLGVPKPTGLPCTVQGHKVPSLEFQSGPMLRGMKETFNYAHSSLRNVNERSFGVLKMKWRILLDFPSFPM